VASLALSRWSTFPLTLARSNAPSMSARAAEAVSATEPSGHPSAWSRAAIRASHWSKQRAAAVRSRGLMMGDSSAVGAIGQPGQVSPPTGPLATSMNRATPSAAFGAPSNASLRGRLQGGLGELFHASREVVVKRPIGYAAHRKQLRPPGGRVPLIAEQPRHRLYQVSPGVAVSDHRLTLLERMV